MKQIWLIVLIILTLVELSVCQSYYFQDTIKYGKILPILETTLFPKNPLESKQLLYEGCSKSHDRLYLLLRPNRPNPQVVITLIEKVFYQKDTSLINPLYELYKTHLEYFQKEWSWGFDQVEWCSEFKDQLQVIEALEKAIFGLKIRSQYLDNAEYYNFIIAYSEAKILPHLWNQVLHSPPGYSALIDSVFDNEAKLELFEMSKEEIQIQTSLSNQIHQSQYTTDIQAKYNAFGSVNLMWNYFSPFIFDINKYLERDYAQYKRLSNMKSLEYKIKSYLFNVQLRSNDNKIMGFIK